MAARRLGSFQQLDLLLSKKASLLRLSFDFYIDMRNTLLTRQISAYTYIFDRLPDNCGYLTTDSQPLRSDGSNIVPFCCPTAMRW